MHHSRDKSSNAHRFVPAESPHRVAAREWGVRSVSAVGTWAHRLAGSRSRGRFGILMYHRIAEEVPGLPRPTINVPPAQFRRQIQGLRRRGFVFWPLQRVLALAAAGHRIPPYVTVLTLDDGFEGVHQHAWPVLRHLRVPATIFLASAYLGSQEPFPFDHWGRRFRDQAPPACYRPLSLSQCHELAACEWIDLGAHTHSHEDFRLRPDEFRDDLGTNVQFIREQFGRTNVTFAFPYGTPTQGFAAPELIAAAQDVGVLCGLTTESELVDPTTSPFAWGRLNVLPWDDAASLAAKLGGWYDWAPRWKNRLLDRPTTVAAGQAPRGRRCARLQPHRTDCTPSVQLSVIVPTRNRAPWLGEALRSLATQRTNGCFTFEIIVVNNASHDETATVVQQFAATSAVPVRYFQQSRRGDAPTRNRGVAEAEGTWLAFFDDDQLAEPDWLLELWRAAELTGGLIVGGPVRLDLPSRELQSLGPWCRQALREIELYPELHPYLGHQLPGTGNALVARRVFDAVGRFDESFASGGSDYDFFKRARAAGFDLWYAPQAAIRHRVDPRRLTAEYLRRDAMSGGAEHASYFDHQQHGLAGLLLGAMARAGQALLIHLPLLALASLRRDQQCRIGCWTRLWRTAGYLRRTAAIVAAADRPHDQAAPSFE